MTRKLQKKRKEEIKKIAIKNIQELFYEAQKIFKISSELSDKYIKVALNTRNKANVVLTKQQKCMYCKKCFAFLVPGENCFVRIKNKYLIYHCKKCGNIRKFKIEKS
jgi:ribonuclease P protein subunit RPR2